MVLRRMRCRGLPLAGILTQVRVIDGGLGGAGGVSGQQSHLSK
jgi:hypothetical protein